MMMKIKLYHWAALAKTQHAKQNIPVWKATTKNVFTIVAFQYFMKA